MKKVITIFCFFSVLFEVFAMDYNVAISKARELSATMEYYNSSYEYQNGLLQSQDLKNRLAVGIDVSDITIAEENHLFPSVKVSFTLPEYVKDMTVVATLSANHSDKTILSDEYYKLTPGLSLSKSFTFKDYEDSQEDLAKEKNRNLLDTSYEKQVLSFENSFIDSLISIMQLKVNIRKLQSDLSKLEANYEAETQTGSIDKGSLKEITADKTLAKSRAQLDKSIQTLDAALKAFENAYGFAYEDITYVPQTDLTFEPDVTKSITVRNAQIALESAKQKLDEKLGNKTTVKVGLTASTDVKLDGDRKYAETTVSTGATAALIHDNLSLSAIYDGEISKDKFKPSLTISGKWNNDSKPKEVSDLEILELQNAYIKAKNDYDDAVFKYDSQSKSLLLEIETMKTDFEMQAIDDSYDLTVLQYKQDLFSKGLITQIDLNDAIAEVELDEAERISLQLQAIQLKNKIITNNF